MDEGKAFRMGGDYDNVVLFMIRVRDKLLHNLANPGLSLGSG